MVGPSTLQAHALRERAEIHIARALREVIQRAQMHRRPQHQAEATRDLATVLSTLTRSIA